MQNHLKHLINTYGPLEIDTIINEVLVATEGSYYQKSDTLGHHADFITAPEISQLFSEMIAIWVRLCWQQLPNTKILLVELGPGRGLLMEAILRFNAEQPEFKKIFDVVLIERSQILRQTQREKLKEFDVNINWYDSFQETDYPERPIILIANEFWDALPIKQYVRENDCFYERAVSLNQKNQFIFTNITCGFEDMNLDNGAIYEYMQEGIAQMGAISDYLVKNQGAALIVDYGYELVNRPQESYVSTLQAIKNHRYVDVLESLGQADLSAHVDFSQLKQVVDTKLSILGSIQQSELLQMLGIELRLQQLLRNTQNPEIYQIILRQYHRLMSVAQMGQLYKALMVASFDLQKIFGLKS